MLLRSKFLIAGAALALVAGVGLWAARPDPPANPAGRELLGLLTTLPIYWPEADDPAELLQGAGEVHWARTALERSYELKPLDTLTNEGGLGSVKLLILAQPRALSPQENVALDNWVREGGRLLLFADPFLTGHYHFAIGDRRRPQDVVLLSPILARWGLELTFPEDQPEDVWEIAINGRQIPVALAGEFFLRPPAGGAQADCKLLAGGVAAQCAIGKGEALIMADAALLEDGEASAELDHLTRLAFPSG